MSHSNNFHFIFVISMETRGFQVATWVDKSQIKLKSKSFLNEASVKSHDRNKNASVFQVSVKVDTEELQKTLRRLQRWKRNATCRCTAAVRQRAQLSLITHTLRLPSVCLLEAVTDSSVNTCGAEFDPKTTVLSSSVCTRLARAALWL